MLVIYCVAFAVKLGTSIWERRNADYFEEFQDASDDIRTSVVIAIVGLIGVTGLAFVLWWVKHQRELLPRLVWQIKSFAPLILLVLLVIGVAAYFLRKKYQATYGAAEITFGLVLSGMSIGSIDVERFYSTLAALVAGIYIVVRGCTNVEEGIAQWNRLEGERHLNDLRKWADKYDVENKPVLATNRPPVPSDKL